MVDVMRLVERRKLLGESSVLNALRYHDGTRSGILFTDQRPDKERGSIEIEE